MAAKIVFASTATDIVCPFNLASGPPRRAGGVRASLRHRLL